MPRINLLPHRESKRKERKLKFMVALVAATGAGIVAAFVAYLSYGSMIQSQEHRNNELRAEIKTLDKQIEEINDLESAKQKFIARMNIIEKLQRSRPEIVHVFDAIVHTLPEGVYLTAVKQTGKDTLKFDGIAQSSTRVSSFMRNIDGSTWLRNPELAVVQTSKTGAGSSFTLTADEVNAAGADDDNGAAAGARKAKIRKASLDGVGARQ
jgi:type IV pilus assembly protein PilN